MILAFAINLALAQEPPADGAEPTPEPPAGSAEPSPEPTSDGPAVLPTDDPPPPGEDAEIDASGPELRFHIPERWEYDPFFRPDGGFSLYAGSGYIASAIAIGLVGGVQYWDQESRLHGQTRAKATGLLLSGGLGYDLRVGSFIGPADKYWSVQVGPDVFRNGFRAGGFVMEPSLGIDFVTRATLGPPEAFLIAGVTPAVLFNPDRRVNWDAEDHIGFGHEFEWQLGAVIDAGPLHLGAIYSRRITAVGIQQGVGFSLGL